MTRPSGRTVPMSTLMSLPLHHPRHILGQEHILILSAVIPSLTNDGRFNQEFPPALLGKVFGILGGIEGHLQEHIARQWIGTGNPPHQRIVPRFGSLPPILEGDDPRRFFGEGSLSGVFGLFLFDDHPFFGPVNVQWDLIHVGRVEGGHLGLVFGEDRIGQGGAYGEYRVGVDGVQVVAILLDFGLLVLEMGLAFDVFGVMFDDG